jgi:hypothetical protein
VAWGVAVRWRKPDDTNSILNATAKALPQLTEDLRHVQDARLALLMDLEFTRTAEDTTVLDGVIRGHTFSPEEVASIKPDLFRIARGSKLVRQKLSILASQLPEGLVRSLEDLERTNLFTLVSPDKN